MVPPPGRWAAAESRTKGISHGIQLRRSLQHVAHVNSEGTFLHAGVACVVGICTERMGSAILRASDASAVYVLPHRRFRAAAHTLRAPIQAHGLHTQRRD